MSLRLLVTGLVVVSAALCVPRSARAQAEVPIGIDTSYDSTHHLVPLEIGGFSTGIVDCPGGGQACNTIECPVSCDPAPFADVSGTGLYGAICAGGNGITLTFYVTFNVPGDICTLNYASERCTDHSSSSYACQAWEVVDSGSLLDDITDESEHTVTVPGTMDTGYRLRVWVSCRDEVQTKSLQCIAPGTY
jgi:hypothetical protein